MACSPPHGLKNVDYSAKSHGTWHGHWTVPSNISPVPFIQFAADNNDLKEET